LDRRHRGRCGGPPSRLLAPESQWPIEAALTVDEHSLDDHREHHSCNQLPYHSIRPAAFGHHRFDRGTVTRDVAIHFLGNFADLHRDVFDHHFDLWPIDQPRV
jgi:hypothetical protein